MLGKTLTHTSIKVEILDYLKSKSMTRANVVKKYGIGLSTVSKIVKDEEPLHIKFLNNSNINRKHSRDSIHKDVNEATTAWLHQARASNAVVTDCIIKKKAALFAVSLGVEFEPSKGWLMRWKQTNNISFKKFHGEKAAADGAVAGNCIKNVLPDLLVNYVEKDIYNADETGLFIRLCPVVLQQVPVTSQLEVKFQKTLRASGGNIVLFADNATCNHLPPDVMLTNIKLQFMPPNTASLIQPQDQSMIRTMRAYYRREIVRLQVAAIDSVPQKPASEVSKTITVLKAMHMLKWALFMVMPQTIANCFKKVGFVKRSEDEERDSEHDDEEDVAEALHVQGITQQEFLSFVNIDEGAECYGEMTDQEIVDTVMQPQAKVEDDKDEEGEESVVPPPTNLQAIQALDTLTAYFDHSDNTYARKLLATRETSVCFPIQQNKHVHLNKLISPSL
uniref:HTH CENPB-type domain-containing protein n=1 Tax=Eptatretus burgeri TaxID=7764 RepID=A0A8C4WZC2_EPTBU